MEHKTTEINAAASLKSVMKKLFPQIKDSSVLITYGKLPKVVINNERLEEIFQSLINHSIKSRRGVHPRIHISSDENESEYIFLLQENGKGNDETLFNENPGNDDNPDISDLKQFKKLVEEIDGEVWVNSFPNVGSIFYFTIRKERLSGNKRKNVSNKKIRDRIN